MSKEHAEEMNTAAEDVIRWFLDDIKSELEKLKKKCTDKNAANYENGVIDGYEQAIEMLESRAQILGLFPESGNVEE